MTIDEKFIKILKNSGFNHPNFKGIYDSNRKIRNSPAYRKFKKSVLKRDGKTCQYCTSQTKLHVHHIKPFAKFPKLRFDINNGITLCQKCHIKLHKNE